MKRHGNQEGSITALVCRALLGAPWVALVRNIYSAFLCSSLYIAGLSSGA